MPGVYERAAVIKIEELGRSEALFMAEPLPNPRPPWYNHLVLPSISTETTSAAMPRGERRKQHTKRRLLDAAAATYAEVGVDGATIGAMTEKADVGLGTFYLHFEDKDAIALAVNAVITQRLLADHERSCDSVRSVGGEPDLLAVFTQVLCARAAESPGLIAALLRWTGPKQSGAQGSLHDGLRVHLERCYHLGVERSRYRIEDPKHMAEAVFGIYAEVIPAWSANGRLTAEGSGERLGAFVQRAVVAMCRVG